MPPRSQPLRVNASASGGWRDPLKGALTSAHGVSSDFVDVRKVGYLIADGPAAASRRQVEVGIGHTAERCQQCYYFGTVQLDVVAVPFADVSGPGLRHR